MSSSTRHAEETSTQNAKRQRPDEVQELTYCLNDSELLKCPLCSNFLHQRCIYQCGDGHIACSGCCDKVPRGMKCPTCSEPTGKMMRCIFLETFLKSLQVRCKYAPHGCEKKFIHIADHISSHERHCRCMPFPCPFEGCVFKGSWMTTPEHLTEVHQVPTVEYSSIVGAGFTMKSLDRIVMVRYKGTRADWRSDLIFVHREPLHETLHGDVFFCTSVTSFGSYRIELKVAYEDFFYTAMLNANTVGSAGEYLNKDFLLLPLGFVPPVESDFERLVEVHLKVTSSEDYPLYWR